MKIELVRVRQESFRYYLRLDGSYVIDPRFVYDHIQAGKEKFDHVKEIASKFGETDYEVGDVDNISEETVIDSIEVNKGDNFHVMTKISGRLSIKK